jgi:hypothetical protein
VAAVRGVEANSVAPHQPGDGEVVAASGGLAVFERLHRKHEARAVFPYAFARRHPPAWCARLDRGFASISISNTHSAVTASSPEVDRQFELGTPQRPNAPSSQS